MRQETTSLCTIGQKIPPAWLSSKQEQQAPVYGWKVQTGHHRNRDDMDCTKHWHPREFSDKECYSRDTCMHALLEDALVEPEKLVAMDEWLAALERPAVMERRRLGSLVQQVPRLCAQVHIQQMHQTLEQRARASRA